MQALYFTWGDMSSPYFFIDIELIDSRQAAGNRNKLCYQNNLYLKSYENIIHFWKTNIVSSELVFFFDDFELFSTTEKDE